MLVNAVRAYRERTGLSQGELASRIGISRQSVRLIEAGDTVPSTLVALRLAALFQIRVEDLFHDQQHAEENVVVAAEDDLEVGDRVVLSENHGQTIAHRLPLLGSYTGAGGLATVAEVRGGGRLRITPSPYRGRVSGAAVAGCDPALQLLTHESIPSRALFWRNADNAQALRLLDDGFVHAAAVHAPGDGSALEIAHRARAQLVRFHFATWQLGWIVRRGNPSGFRGAEDLGTGRFRLVNRRQGAGTRTLLDRLIAEADVNPEVIPQYDWIVDSHVQVAMAVESGAADVGLAISAVAGPLRLDFLPVHTERCELWVPKENLEDAAIQAVLQQLSTDRFRWDLAAFGDYDVTHTGMQV